MIWFVKHPDKIELMGSKSRHMVEEKISSKENKYQNVRDNEFAIVAIKYNLPKTES